MKNLLKVSTQSPPRREKDRTHTPVLQGDRFNLSTIVSPPLPPPPYRHFTGVSKILLTHYWLKVQCTMMDSLDLCQRSHTENFVRIYYCQRPLQMAKPLCEANLVANDITVIRYSLSASKSSSIIVTALQFPLFGAVRIRTTVRAGTELMAPIG